VKVIGYDKFVDGSVEDGRADMDPAHIGFFRHREAALEADGARQGHDMPDCHHGPFCELIGERTF
jgi:hypothetical protein